MEHASHRQVSDPSNGAGILCVCHMEHVSHKHVGAPQMELEFCLSVLWSMPHMSMSHACERHAP